ncbi:carbohydrate kinase family protein [Halosolutus halophilus]|uniref:carbohydrate kinase family protein n=1 Tax=Halosolutus halophilus TaxID=1552990 RepID=UPI002235277C|nr:carbohydrate kinase [Halosolutus halophilus]
MTQQLLVAGDTLVDFLPNRPGRIADVESFSPKFGGSAANVAVALERIGHPPLFWTRIARDRFGDYLADALHESAIPDRFVVRDPDAKTTLAFVSNDEDGERQFDFYRAGTADTRMQTGTVPDETLADVSWVHLTGVTMSVEPSRGAMLDLAARARRQGCTVSLDPNTRPEMWASEDEFATVIRDVLEQVDVVKATPEDLEAAGFDDDDPEALAAAVAAFGPHTVLLTLGGEGAFSYGTSESPLSGIETHGGYDVDVVDTTGAGDGFLAGAIASLAAGVESPERVLAVANAVGAITTTKQGSVTALTGADPIRELVGPLPWD